MNLSSLHKRPACLPDYHYSHLLSFLCDLAVSTIGLPLLLPLRIAISRRSRDNITSFTKSHSLPPQTLCIAGPEYNDESYMTG